MPNKKFGQDGEGCLFRRTPAERTSLLATHWPAAEMVAFDVKDLKSSKSLRGRGEEGKLEKELWRSRRRHSRICMSIKVLDFFVHLCYVLFVVSHFLRITQHCPSLHNDFVGIQHVLPSTTDIHVGCNAVGRCHRIKHL